MKRDEIYKDIEGIFGLVPSFLKLLPDSTLELEWALFKRIQLEEGAIPNKYKELIGLGINAVSRCRYCTLFHTEMAKLYGATEEDIEEAVHYAKASAGWSTYLNGMQVDYETFRKELKAAVGYVRKNMEKKAA